MAWDLTNEGLDFTPQRVSLQALLSGQAPQKNVKWFKNKGDAMAQANSLLQSTPTSAFSVSPSQVDSVLQAIRLFTRRNLAPRGRLELIPRK